MATSGERRLLTERESTARFEAHELLITRVERSLRACFGHMEDLLEAARLVVDELGIEDMGPSPVGRMYRLVTDNFQPQDHCPAFGDPAHNALECPACWGAVPVGTPCGEPGCPMCDS